MKIAIMLLGVMGTTPAWPVVDDIPQRQLVEMRARMSAALKSLPA